WPCYRPAEKPTTASLEDQGAVPDRGRVERRSALAQRKERPQRNLRESQTAGRDRGLLRGARLVPAGFARLQRAGRRKGLDASAGPVRQNSALVLRVIPKSPEGAASPCSTRAAAARGQPSQHAVRRWRMEYAPRLKDFRLCRLELFRPSAIYPLVRDEITCTCIADTPFFASEFRKTPLA